MPLITNKKALNMFEKMKNDNVPLCKIDTFFKDYIGENESINSDALVRKLRRTNENLKKNKGKYRTDFEAAIFEIPVRTVTARGVKKPIMATFESEAVNLTLMSLSNTLKVQNKEIKNKELLLKEKIEVSKHLQQNKVKEMTEKEKKLKKRLMNGKQKRKNLGMRIYFSREKENEMKKKIKTSKKYQKLERDCSYLLTKEKVRSKELLSE